MSNPKSLSDATHDRFIDVEPRKLSGKMATVIANKPAPPNQKMKRPPSAVPTNANGVKTSQSPSPSLAHKRLPSTIKYPAAASGVGVNGPNGLVNGAARLNNRRRDSQKPGDIQPRSSRPSKGGQGENSSDKRKKLAEPYGMPPPLRLGFRSSRSSPVNMTTYILKKFKNKQPSLIIHLHQTHFRFDQQDGSFSYNSPMKFLLEHLRSQTIPHDMIEELNAAAVKYYEGMIVVGHDEYSLHQPRMSHRASARPQDHRLQLTTIFLYSNERQERSVLGPQLQRASHTISIRPVSKTSHRK